MSVLTTAPPSPRRLAGPTLSRLVFAAYVVWHLGAHVDAWYHIHHGFAIETFLTWPHLMLYAGVAATGGLVAAALLEGRRRGAGAPDLPPGLGAVGVGTALFLAGGVFDFAWHEAFGFEVNVETLFTPAHLWLVLASAVAAAGLLRHAQAARTARGLGGWRPRPVDLPVVLAVAIALRIVLWNFYYSEPGAVDYAAEGVHAGRLPGYHGIAWADLAARVAGTTGIVLHALVVSLFLVGPVRWLRLPGGAIAVGLLWNGLLTAATTGMWHYLPAVVLGAAVGEALWARIWRGGLGGIDGRAGYWVLGAAVPAVEQLAYFALMALVGGGIAWTTHLWAGAVAMAGAAGLAVALAVAPPRLVDAGRGAAR